MDDQDVIRVLGEELMGWPKNGIPNGWNPMLNQAHYSQVKEKILQRRDLISKIQKEKGSEIALELETDRLGWCRRIASYL